ncbi:MAG: hypothetical protein ABJO88_13820, partial [Parasphingorhabdus sp.]
RMKHMHLVGRCALSLIGREDERQAAPTRREAFQTAALSRKNGHGRGGPKVAEAGLGPVRSGDGRPC